MVPSLKDLRLPVLPCGLELAMLRDSTNNDDVEDLQNKDFAGVDSIERLEYLV